MLRLVGAAVMLLVFFTPAVAQDEVRETVVVTAAASPVTLGSVTRALTVITRDQLAQLPVQTVADALRLASSVDVRARGVRGAQTDFSVRGATFGQMLMLIDGVRLNDPQSGHHNGDIPVPLEAIERIEILQGAGSSLFGADAFGGTINIITRRDAAPSSLTLQAGSFGLMAGRGQASVARGGVSHRFAASADHSDGFMFERGFTTAGLNTRTSLGARTGISASYLWKDFGANGFYGNAPSHEWTNQTLLSADHQFVRRAGWQLSGVASYRTHGDRFLFNVTRPGVSENFHRTHAALATFRASRTLRQHTSVTVGGEGGGDWIRSSNLGDHTIGRVSGFGEWRYAPTARTQVDASLRFDRYSQFGAAWSPALGLGWWPSRATRLRASAARAFRVPTFTERFYRDPANVARSEVGAETAWAGDAGLDLFLTGGLSLSATLFTRFEDDVIDWLRPTTADIWRTYNVRDVDTHGLELSVRKLLPGGAFLQAGYTRTDVNAAAITQLSKYVLDYAPHALTAAAVISLPARLRLAPRIEYKHRTRSSGTSDYTLVDARLGRRFGIAELFVEGTNLLNYSYQEIAFVPMPGRAAMVSLALTAR